MKIENRQEQETMRGAQYAQRSNSKRTHCRCHIPWGWTATSFVFKKPSNPENTETPLPAPTYPSLPDTFSLSSLDKFYATSSLSASSIYVSKLACV